MYAILFVCLGNICRSPMAAGALRAHAAQAGLRLTIDSAGTGDWHIGRAPDPRAQAVARNHGIDIADMRARQVTASDFTRFTHIFALDHQNLADLSALAPPTATAHLSLLLDLVPGKEGQDVSDPYYGNDAGFEASWQQIDEATRQIVARLQTVSSQPLP